MTPRVWVALCVGLGLSLSCAKKDSLPASGLGDGATVVDAETRAIAEEAYVYAYPMMENYRTMYVQAIDRTAYGYAGPFNQLTHGTELLGPEFEDVVRPNNDTIYSFAWLDLRAEPIVITVPSVEDRYYSVQLIDMFTHNFGYIGTRATGTASGHYVVAGADWKGTQPGDASELLRSESDFVYCIIRIEVRGLDDLAAVRRVQQGFRITPLHAFLGRSRAPAASGITFPAYDAIKAKSAAFIDLLNFLLAQVSAPDDAALLRRFSRIGIEPGATAASLGLDPAMREEIEAGIGNALIAIEKAAQNPATLDGVRVRSEGGWRGVDGLFGPGEAMREKLLARAAAAKVGLYGNDTIEAYYPIANTDRGGEPLDGTENAYVIRFESHEMPPVKAFWSMTLYGLPDQLMVANAIDRYSIGDRSPLRRAEDGSLTIYIQHESPGKKLESNWLPAPNGPFSLQFRMYLPEPEALDPLYLPPPVRVRQ